ncbi:hypothetical protein LLS1_37210 [Leifsonia sp. LS1]|nr:hypothetical protein LLS1_37210 [Leifsonia sp. LS1]
MCQRGVGGRHITWIGGHVQIEGLQQKSPSTTGAEVEFRASHDLFKPEGEWAGFREIPDRVVAG